MKRPRPDISVFMFEPDEAVPDWLLTVEGANKDAVLGKFVFQTRCAVMTMPEGNFVVPIDGALPAVTLREGRNCNILAVDTRVSFFAVRQIINPVLSGVRL